MSIYLLFIIINIVFAIKEYSDYQLAICTVQKNEGIYLPDWLKFHHYLGVNNFMIFDDNSTDHSIDSIQKWAEKTGDIWLKIERIYTSSGILQAELYQRCIERWRGKKYWIAFIDLDELLIPVKKNNLLKVLEKFKINTGVFVSSKIMCDYDGKNENNLDKNFIERFTNYAWTNRSEYIQGKIIVNANHPAIDYCRFGTYDPTKEERWRFMHNCFWSFSSNKEDYSLPITQYRKLPKEYWVRNDKGRALGHPYVDIHPQMGILNPSYLELQLNHYKFRSYKECLKKIERGYSWYGIRYGEYKKWPQFAKEKSKPKYCDIMKRKGHCWPKKSIRARNIWQKIFSNEQ